MTRNKLRYLVLIALVAISIPVVNRFMVKADTNDTATLRIMATSDLHGQVTSYDYETNLPLTKNGLSKIATLVEKKRSEVGADNSLLLDDGDFLYDYSTNYFYDNYNSYVQPILKAMSIMNYDYINLGNHEFDYPWAYLKSQLINSNMYDKVVVCNTIWHDNGVKVFAPSAVVTKNLTTSSGATIKVKIGVIGSTTNSISTRRGDYVNEIDALNNYDSIVKESDRLKNQEHVDIVIVLIHGGIGLESSLLTSDNIGYALTKVDSIDAVVTGHTHETFPIAKGAAISSSSIDTVNGLINGKPVVATSSHAKAFGIIDLTLAIDSNGTVIIDSGKASINYVTAETQENSLISTMFHDYQNKLIAGADTQSYPIAAGVAYHNYDTVLQDSNLYQLFNNAKISYGLTYIAQYLPTYKNVPIIACTRNLLDSNEPYVLIKDSFSSKKVSQILSESSPTRPSGHVQIIAISGKALREWLEYNASIYATQGTTFQNILKTYVSNNKDVSTLLQESNIYNWNNQYVFDGIAYKIDLRKKARYSSVGSLVSSTNHRISTLTYQGVEVTDAQKFVLVTDDGMPTLSFLPSETAASLKEVRDNATGKGITLDYISRLSKFDKISIKADNNWSLTAGTGYSFLLGVPKKIVNTVSSYSWNNGLATETLSYSFLKGTLPVYKQSINMIASQGRTEVNNVPVPIIISASSAYAIQNIKYLLGTITSVTDTKWTKAAVATNNTFTANNNDNYTIMVTDSKNNHELTYIKVDRYNTDILPSPKLNKLTNRNSEFTGTGVAYSTVHITIGANTYTTTVKDNGTFRVSIAPPKAFSPISVYVDYSGKISATVTAAVRKTGPDAVVINKIKVGNTNITGITNPHTFVYALIWTTVYVGKGQTEDYIRSDFYTSKYKISETDITVDKDTGAYSINVPSTKSDMKVYVFAYDRFGVTSKSTMSMSTY